MIEIKKFAPNMNEIRKYMPKEVVDKIVFTWGDVVCNPYGLRLDPAIMRHESTHFTQQMRFGKNKFWQNFTLPRHRIEKWWKRYLRDYAFRLSQEIPAYQAQYREYKNVLKGKELEDMAVLLAKDLSSPLYGKLINTAQALKAIKREIIYDFSV